MFATLNVYLNNRFCGQIAWESERNRFVFRYVAEYLSDPEAERLSFALPLQAEAFDEEVSFNYFANLLPPEVVRRKLGARLPNRRRTASSTSGARRSRSGSDCGQQQIRE